MIYINNTILSTKLYIEKQSGLFDFPKIKAKEKVFDGTDFVEFGTDQKEWQYEGKTIKLNCLIVGNTFDLCLAAFNSIKSSIQVDELLNMTIPSYSNRAYLVELKRASYVSTNYDDGYCVFRFDLEFYEPQPFNIQFRYTIGAVPLTLGLEIGLEVNEFTEIAEKQKFINVYFQGVTTEVNITNGNYDQSFTLAANTTHHCIITGDIDAVNYIVSSRVPDDETIANYYFRNGTIDIVAEV